MSWILAVISVVYLSAATMMIDPHDFVSCCIVGYLAARTAGYWWEDSQ